MVCVLFDIALEVRSDAGDEDQVAVRYGARKESVLSVDLLFRRPFSLARARGGQPGDSGRKKLASILFAHLMRVCRSSPESATGGQDESELLRTLFIGRRRYHHQSSPKGKTCV